MRRLFPVLLRLAAGSEPVAQQLFRELVLALVHWFTRSARKCAAVCQPENKCFQYDSVQTGQTRLEWIGMQRLSVLRPAEPLF